MSVRKKPNSAEQKTLDLLPSKVVDYIISTDPEEPVTWFYGVRLYCKDLWSTLGNNLINDDVINALAGRLAGTLEGVW